MKRNPSKLIEKSFDLLIIGGGINGAGAARDAAMRGLKVALVDKGDFACGTSSASSKLIHGGLRYLEQCNFRLVREALAERKILLQIAPHIAHPLRFYLPIYRNQKRGKLAIRLGLFLYDILAGSKNIGRHQMLKRQELLSIYPDIHTDGLVAAASYYDAWMDDTRLCLANLIDADRRGAIICNYIEAAAVETDPAGGYSITAEDKLSSQSYRIRAGAVLNVTGPWSDRFMQSAFGEHTKRLQASKGVHLIFSRPAGDYAALLIAPDNRVFFMIPWYGATMVGTTDTPFDADPDNLQVTKEDIDYLLDAISNYFGTRKQWQDCLVSSFAGIRPLVGQAGSSTYRTSREHLLIEDRPGFFSLLGGKYTTYRAMAQSTLDAVCRYLKIKANCQTHLHSLPGGEIPDYSSWADDMDKKLAETIDDEQMRSYLMRTFGTEVEVFIKNHGGERQSMERIDRRFAIPRAIIEYSRDCEMAQTSEDITRRRTPLALLGYKGDLI